ncbi:MAG: exodeoxyribonuclease VII large subunit [Bacilli bacterium]|nr:exodeoxyribonuclease VII large subunit [Bacilli bacterium]
MNNKYLTISQINEYVKMRIDSDANLKKIYLKGEISNFKNHTRGHLYFTLKDDNSRLSAVMFQSQAYNLKFTPEDGMNVLVEGRLSCYPAQGTYQIYVDKMEMDGLGELYLEFEKLKKKLSEEGLFDEKYKKPIPRYPSKIGIVTASTGAAIKDILSTIKRRYPICETILFPSLVQGAGAGNDVAKQIETAQNYDLDILIVGRGGGSIEDLWAFNEEVVARAIFKSKVPIISAVGHEVDFTIADYVADLRAPTPTGAAEMAVPVLSDVISNIDTLKIRLRENILKTLKQSELRLNKIKDSFILTNPLAMYEVKEEKLNNYIITLNKYIREYLNNKRHILNLDLNSLKLLNPVNIMEKGYSLVRVKDQIIKDSKDLKNGDKIDIKLYKGEVIAEVKEIK